MRENRKLPEDYQGTFCLCEKCGESYEADREHICRKKNSYPFSNEPAEESEISKEAQ